MKIDNILDLLAQSANTSFVYDLSLSRFIYVDDNLKHNLKIDWQAEGAAILSLVYQDDIESLKQSFTDLLNGSFNGNTEFRVHADDNLRCLRLTPFLLSFGNEKIITGNIIDITAEINNRYSLEKFANKKNSILSMLSHDLRGPLEIARMIAQSLGNDAPDAATRNQSQNLVKILKQGLDLVNDLIHREATETVSIELVRKRISISAKLKEYFDELKDSQEALHRIINFTSTADDIYLHVDESKFMQIMNNLVTNALKFTHNGDSITLAIKDQGDTVLFIFSDTGIGIPKEFQAELFEKFTPARRKGLNGEPSIGMGMSIVKTLVEWHQGRIWVESEEGKGTTFYFEIPKNSQD